MFQTTNQVNYLPTFSYVFSNLCWVTANNVPVFFGYEPQDLQILLACYWVATPFVKNQWPINIYWIFSKRNWIGITVYVPNTLKIFKDHSKFIIQSFSLTHTPILLFGPDFAASHESQSNTNHKTFNKNIANLRYPAKKNFAGERRYSH